MGGYPAPLQDYIYGVGYTVNKMKKRDMDRKISKVHEKNFGKLMFILCCTSIHLIRTHTVSTTR